MSEVIYNLIDNGIKYNRENGSDLSTVAVIPGEQYNIKDTREKERKGEQYRQC